MLNLDRMVRFKDIRNVEGKVDDNSLELEFDTYDCDDRPIRVYIPWIDLTYMTVPRDAVGLNGPNMDTAFITLKARRPPNGLLYNYSSKVKKMTLEEIEKKLGYKVEIIG